MFSASRRSLIYRGSGKVKIPSSKLLLETATESEADNRFGANERREGTSKTLDLRTEYGGRLGPTSQNVPQVWGSYV